MPPPPPLPQDLLLAHSGALRALARSLLRDGHAAEDALHDTFVRALEHPPASVERVGAWLRAVLESVVRKQKRGDGRRSVRERESARHERVHAADAERGDALRAVLEAVLALDEPYREVVLDRYFENLPPREIARRRGLPLNTVASRLARARARLRERLGRDGHDWRASLSATFGFPLPRAGAALVPGALALSTTTKLGAASALLAAAGIGWYASRGRAVEPGPEALSSHVLEPPAEREATPRGAPRIDAASEAPAQRTSAAASAPAATSRAAPPYRYELLVLARDGEDRPLADAQVFVAPRGARWNAAGRTNARGELALAFRGFAPTLDLALSVRPSFGRASVERRVTLAAGARTGVALGPPGAGAIEFAFTLAEGDVQRGAIVASGMSLEGGVFELRAVATSHASTAGAPAVATYADAAAFAEPFVAPPVEREDEARVVRSFETVELAEILRGRVESHVAGELLHDLGYVQTSDDEPEQAAGDADRSVARGFVRNAAGRALAGVRVEARDADGLVRADTYTGEEGEYELAVHSSMRLLLSAGGGDHGLAATEWNASVERELRWSPVLDRGHELLGRLVDGEGAPLAGWIIEVEADDEREPWWDGATSGDDGRFAIPNLPRRALRLVARAPEARHGRFALVAENVWPDLEERRFELGKSLLAAGSVRIAVQDAAGRPLEDADLRLWQVASGRGSELTAADERGVYVAKDLPAGDYELEVGDALHGFVALQGFSLAAGETLDLGNAALAPLAELAFVAPSAGDASEALRASIWRRADEVELHVLELDAWPDAPLALRAGEYELTGELGGTRVARRIVLRPGERLELSIETLRDGR